MTKKKKTEEEPQELTTKEYAFVMEYLKDYNGARAARACGYNANNPQNARGTAYEILTKPHIVKFIAQHKADLAQEVKITQNDILNLCREIMTAKPTDYYDGDLYEIAIDEESPNQRAIQSLCVITRMDDDGEVLTKTEKLIMRDPLKAAQLAAKILGLDETDDSEDLSIEVTVTHLAPQNKAIDTVTTEETIETVVEFDDAEVTTPEISIKINKK